VPGGDDDDHSLTLWHSYVTFCNIFAFEMLLAFLKIPKLEDYHFSVVRF
jgi:hypothetical protein